MLRLNEDFSAFKRMARSDPVLRLALRRRALRLLRAPTIWEEATRILCTTNMHWQGTVAMIARLCFLTSGDFPTPYEILTLGESRLRIEARMGYRAMHLIALATRVTTGEEDIECWKEQRRPAAELRRRILAWPSFWPYATAHLLVQLGHYEELPIDSEVRAFHPELADDEAIRATYAPYGDYAFLAYKLRRIALRTNWIGKPTPFDTPRKSCFT